LRAELEGIASLFSDAARGEQQTALPARETAAGLSGRRIALLGFQPADAARLSRALDQAQASSRILTPPLAPPGSPALGPFDLLILFLCRQTEDSHWSDPQALLRNGKPLLLIGPLDLLHEKTAALQEHAADFLLSPWHTGEVLLRASRILSAPRVAARSAAGPALDVLVLVADDDLTIGALLTATLQNCGIQCQIARHGVQALEMARSLRPDALVLDIMMPHLDGFEVLASLKSDPATRPIPVLLLTARQQEADIVRGFALGAEDYVVKPFNLMELVARLKRLMPRPLPAPVV
jgi:CheY-like chemotaxis protein